jgi:hypothetical protein
MTGIKIVTCFNADATTLIIVGDVEDSKEIPTTIANKQNRFINIEIA